MIIQQVLRCTTEVQRGTMHLCAQTVQQKNDKPMQVTHVYLNERYEHLYVPHVVLMLTA
jgi:hypothetical protein